MPVVSYRRNKVQMVIPGGQLHRIERGLGWANGNGKGLKAIGAAAEGAQPLVGPLAGTRRPLHVRRRDDQLGDFFRRGASSQQRRQKSAALLRDLVTLQQMYR